MSAGKGGVEEIIKSIWVKIVGQTWMKCTETVSIVIIPYFDLAILSTCYQSSKRSDGGLVVRVFAFRSQSRGFKSRSGQIKDLKTGTRCYPVKHSAIKD